MKSFLRSAHRYLGLTLGLIWLLQALSGALLVFHRPLDDRLLQSSTSAIEPVRLDGALARLRAAPYRLAISDVSPSGGGSGQVDVVARRPDETQAVARIEGGTGRILRLSAWDGRPSGMAPARVLLMFHKQFLAGKRGEVLVGSSALLLLTNLILGLRLGWPASGMWRKVLFPRGGRTVRTRLLGWHRALGLWLAPIVLVGVSAGALMVWKADVQRLLGQVSDPGPMVRPLAQNQRPIAFSEALAQARTTFPDASFAGVAFPSKNKAYFGVRLRRPGELRRVFGTTTVYIAAADGRVLGARDALSAPLATRFVASFYPVHTGEWGGWPTQSLTLLAGLSLATSTATGFGLWWMRRRPAGSAPVTRVQASAARDSDD